MSRCQVRLALAVCAATGRFARPDLRACLLSPSDKRAGLLRAAHAMCDAVSRRCTDEHFQGSARVADLPHRAGRQVAGRVRVAPVTAERAHGRSQHVRSPAVSRH